MKKIMLVQSNHIPEKPKVNELSTNKNASTSYSDNVAMSQCSHITLLIEDWQTNMRSLTCAKANGDADSEGIYTARAHLDGKVNARNVGSNKIASSPLVTTHGASSPTSRKVIVI